MITKESPCLVCNDRPTDKCHVKSKGSGGTDEVYNLMPLCRTHHQLQHRIGIVTFVAKYITVWNFLKENGWYWIEVPGGQKLWNEKIREKL